MDIFTRKILLKFFIKGQLQQELFDSSVGFSRLSFLNGQIPASLGPLRFLDGHVLDRHILDQ